MRCDAPTPLGELTAFPLTSWLDFLESKEEGERWKGKGGKRKGEGGERKRKRN